MIKALYKPTNQNTAILKEYDDYCEILLDGEFKTVSKHEIEILCDTLKLNTLDEFKENIFLNCIKEPISDILYSFNTNRLTPEPHQYKPLIKFLNSTNNRVLIADEVGLGKTIEAGMIYKEIDKREDLGISLIVVPSSLTLKWREELFIRFDEYFEIKKTRQFLNFIDEYEQYSNSKKFDEKIIISYHTLRDKKVINKLKNSFLEIDFLIMDEAHSMRNSETTTFQSGAFITSLAEHIVFLSATPVQNSLDDLFNILQLLENDYFKDYDYFRKMIQPNSFIHKLISLFRNNNNIDEIKQYINENAKDIFPQDLNEILKNIQNSDEINNETKINYIDQLIDVDHLSFIINRTKKKDVGRSIPRNAKSMIVDITNEEKEYYEAVIDLVTFLNPDSPQGFITIMPERMASSSMIASLESFKYMKKTGKLFIKDIDDLEDYYDDIDIKKEAMKYLDIIIEKGVLIGNDDSKFLKFEEILKDIKQQKINQLIVFSFFKKTLDYLEKKLIDLGYSVGKIHGDFTVEERFYKINEFRKGNFDILLSSEVGSEGLDMQFCNVVINYDLPWNPMRVEQRIGRIDRIGQKFNKLHIFNLCIEGSIEDRIYNRLYEKLNIFENSIGELEPILGDLETKLNFAELINLSKDELDKKIHLEELAIKRQEKEIHEQNKLVEELVNEDINYKSKEENLLNQKKIKVLQEQTQKVFINFLNTHNIKFIELKNDILKFSSENLKTLFNVLKSLMSDKRNNPIRHKEERSVLQKIHKLNELKVSFHSNNNNEFNILYLYLNHSIINMITKNKTHTIMYSMCSNSIYSDNYSITFRITIDKPKKTSIIKTFIFSKKLSFIEEVDYFDFINECYTISTDKEFNIEDIKNQVTPFIIKHLEDEKQKAFEKNEKELNIKINSIKTYYKKQKEKVKNLQNKVSEENVTRMRIREIENIDEQKELKVKELEERKTVTGSFEILGIMELIND